VLIKSRRALAASALALAAAGGSTGAILAMSSSESLVSPSAMPSLAAPAATATVPQDAGSAQGAADALAPAVEARAGGDGRGLEPYWARRWRILPSRSLASSSI